MNLINDLWIPIRRTNGTVERIAPWQLTDGITDDSRRIVAVASPRPDFDGALVQFLIGLLQTTCTPPDTFTWRKWRREPPAPHELKAKFTDVASAFELEGDIAFMQDFTPSELETELEIGALLIEAPGEQTQEQNKDHFIKRGAINSLCTRCAAMALFTLQTNAPSGGKGYRTSLRGGGPLTTIVLGNSLWETCWLNVLEKSRYLKITDKGNVKDSDRFPWLTKTRVSETKPPAGITTPMDVHPDQYFWAIPRRIRLLAEKSEQPVTCDLCGGASTLTYPRFRTRNYGVNYEAFEHPLSPHYVKGGQPNPVHPQPGGIGYRHWLGLVENSTDGDTQRRPAKVIEQFHSRREDGRLWAFGYDMDNMKARCWYDATMPILSVSEDVEDVFKSLVERLVRGADWVVWTLRGRVKDALLGDTDARGDLSFVQTHFWSATEASFYEHVRRMRDELARSNAERPALESWLGTLRNAALSIFDQYAQTGDFDAADPRRVAMARNDLQKALAGKKLRELLGLQSFARKAA